MLLRVDQPHKIKKLERYRRFIGDGQYNEIMELAKKLHDIKVVHINATPKGGGVSEILKNLVPLMRGVGVETEWRVVPPNPEFFAITKQMHNAIQGKEYKFSFREKKYYIEYNQRLAEWMEDLKADIFVMHDPQPLAVIDFVAKDKAKYISRIHIDSSTPDPDAWKFIVSFLKKYDKVVFSIKEFVPPSFDKNKLTFFMPIIDPLSSKSRTTKVEGAKSILEGLGIDTHRPLITQVSRFDPWKDPVGVVDAYRIVKKEIPSVQLAMLGLFLAQDDPEGESMLNMVKAHAGNDPDIHLFYDVAQIGPLKVDAFVNIFQTASDVILQKSIREGFGITVTEAMWKRKPVVGGNVGGIKYQIEDGKSGFLVNSIEEAASRTIELLKHPDMRKRMGDEARKRVKEHFILPRLLLDYLKLFTDVRK